MKQGTNHTRTSLDEEKVVRHNPDHSDSQVTKISQEDFFALMKANKEAALGFLEKGLVEIQE